MIVSRAIEIFLVSYYLQISSYEFVEKNIEL